MGVPGSTQMAVVEIKSMNISWVLSDQFDLDPTVDINRLHTIGSFWGSWRTWRAYQTDNVVVYDITKAHELIKRNQQTLCNLYVPSKIYTDLGKPSGVKIFEGQFNQEIDHPEEIISLHLAASLSQIILLLGFFCHEQQAHADKLQEHKANNYRNLLKQAMVSNPTTQWVLVDHVLPLRKDLLEIPNLTVDNLDNVIGMLTN